VETYTWGQQNVTDRKDSINRQTLFVLRKILLIPVYYNIITFKNIKKKSIQFKKKYFIIKI
jgi:hypothetical protein